MRTFKDSEGREWKIEINLDARNQVKARTNVDFLDVDTIQKLIVIGDMQDLATLGSVLYALCEEQITERKLTDRDFARALKGDPFSSAISAVEAELIVFFLPARRPMLLKAIEKARTMQAMAASRAEKVIDNLDSAKMNQLLDDVQNKMEKTASPDSSKPSGDLPASSESTLES